MNHPPSSIEPIHNSSAENCFASSPGALLVLHPAINQLWTAFQLSLEFAADSADTRLWEFAVPLDHLRRTGLDDHQLRWLILKGYVVHSSPKPSFALPEHNGNHTAATRLTFAEATLIALSPTGADLLASIHHLLSPVALSLPRMPINGDSTAERLLFADLQPPISARTADSHSTPNWDGERRELWYAGKLVKRFKWTAENQESILAAFEEEHWPSRIDDPLAPQPEQDSKRRLSDTIKCLNRKQTHELLHLRGDGTGEGVIWEPADHDSNRQSSRLTP